MKYVRLGQSELVVSELCLGTMTFGEQNTLAEAKEQLDVAVEHGVNFIDTAEMYPVPTRGETQGRTESYLGEWLSTRARDQLIVATKVSGAGRPLTWLRDGEPRVDRNNVRRALEDSLRRLRTDYVDLYQIHWPDRYVPHFGATEYLPEKERPTTPIPEQLAVFAELVKEGKIRYLGLSNETAWGVTEFSRAAKEVGLPIPSIQNAYSLLNRTFDSALAEVVRHVDIGLLAYSPLGFGFLTGKYAGGPPPGSRLQRFESFGQRYRKANVDQAANAYVQVARDAGLSPAQFALAFVRGRWFVSSTIIGATSRAQLEENLRSLDVTLDAELLAKIESIHARLPNPAP